MFRSTPVASRRSSRVDALRTLIPSPGNTPTPGTNDRYDLTPGATVGVVRVGDLQVGLAPRLPVDRVLFLVS